MYQKFFRELEDLPDKETVPLNEVIDHLVFNDSGLIPVITQDVETKDVLMMAWMNKAAIEKTLSEGRMTYWSRSRNEFWTKGESSGNTQELINMSFDCDGDAVLCQVNQSGPACHTLRPNCFYLKVDNKNNRVTVIGNRG